MYWPAGRAGTGFVTPIAAIGLAVSRHIVADSEERARHKLGIRTMRDWAPDERLWLQRWAPMLNAIEGLERWPAADRSTAIEIVRAKGGDDEVTFARMFDAHPRLRAAIAALA